MIIAEILRCRNIATVFLVLGESELDMWRNLFPIASNMVKFK